MKDPNNWLVVVFLFFVLLIVGSIINWVSCFWFWNTPIAETPARCINFGSNR